MSRSILHCDMNNFYASVECMLDPALKKYPVAVCGSVEERHGIVLAKNYAAKAFGIKTGDAVYFACGMLLYVGWLKFIIHIPFLALFEKENYNVLCGGAKWTI